MFFESSENWNVREAGWLRLSLPWVATQMEVSYGILSGCGNDRVVANCVPVRGELAEIAAQVDQRVAERIFFHSVVCALNGEVYRDCHAVERPLMRPMVVLWNGKLRVYVAKMAIPLSEGERSGHLLVAQCPKNQEHRVLRLLAPNTSAGIQ